MYLTHRKLRSGSGEENMATTHTYKGALGQKNPPTRERLREVSTTRKINKMHIDKINK